MSTPSAYAIQQVVSAWQSARARLLNDDPEADANALLGPETGDVDLILARLLFAAKWSAGQARAMADMIGDLDARRHRFLNREKVARATLASVMEALGRQKVELPLGTVSLGSPRAGVVITDPDLVPDEYVTVETKRKPKLADILDDLKQGVVIEGAELRNGIPTLTIRSK